MSTPLNRLSMLMVYPYNNPPIILPNVDNTVLDVVIQRPQVVDGGKHHYRQHVTARLSLTGLVLRQYSGVVLEGPVLPNQLVLQCYVECSSCILSQHPQCHPVSFYLDPEYRRKYYRPFKLDWSNDTFTGVVTFHIKHRPRKPKPGDPTRRCASEALQLTFFFRDWVGVLVAEKMVGPFQARVHKAKGDHQQHAGGPYYLGNHGVLPAVPPAPDIPLAPSPVEYSAAEAHRLSCLCSYCPYRTAQQPGRVDVSYSPLTVGVSVFSS